MNIVEFALKFKDLASGELTRFGNTTRQTYNSAGKLANDLTGRNRMVGQSYNEIQKRIREVESVIRTSKIPTQIREARRELEQLQKQSNKHIGNIGGKGGDFMSALGLGKAAAPLAIAGAVTAAVAGVGSLVSDSIGKGLERQQIQTSFNVLAGGEVKGSALTDQLVALQKDTILGSEVFKNAQTMMGFGFDSTEVIENLKMLGDVAMGDAQKLGSLTLAFSQIRAGGKLTGQDLLQLINAGFNPLEQMAQRTGKSVSVLKEEMSQGKISFQDVRQAFIDATSEGGKFNNMLEQIAQTPAGKMAQLSGAWDEFKVNAGMAFMPLVSMALGFASKILPLIEGAIAPLSSGIQALAGWITNITSETSGWKTYIDIIRRLFGDHILPVIQKVFGLVFNMVGKLIEFVGQSKLLQGIFGFISVIVAQIFNFIGVLVDAVTWVFNKVVMPIINAIGFAGKAKPVELTSPPDERMQATTNTELLQGIAKNTADNKDLADKAEKGVAGGGPRIVNISVQKFLDAINIHTTTLSEGEADIEAKFLEMFGRVVVQGGYAQ